MTLALATRGYLCNPRSILVPVQAPEPPRLVGVAEQAPDVTNVSTKRRSPPIIINAKRKEPEIRGATESPPTQPVKPPTVRGVSQAPSIRKVKKD